jgi:hypothetical protein
LLRTHGIKQAPHEKEYCPGLHLNTKYKIAAVNGSMILGVDTVRAKSIQGIEACRREGVVAFLTLNMLVVAHKSWVTTRMNKTNGKWRQVVGVTTRMKKTKGKWRQVVGDNPDEQNKTGNRAYKF